MSDRIITAEAVITGRDNTGDTFLQIAKKLRGIGEAAKISPQLDGMSKALERAQGQLKALDKLQGLQFKTSNARAMFEKQTALVAGLRKQVEGISAPTRKMTAEIAAAEGALTKSAEGWRRQASALLVAKRAAEGIGAPIGKMAAGQEHLRSQIDATTRAIEHQVIAEHKAAAASAAAHKAAEKRAEGIAHHGVGRMAAGAAVGYVGAHGVMTGIEKTVESGAERQHVITGMRNAGIPEDEIQRAHTLAAQVSKSAPNMSVSQIMELHKEARSAVQHPDEVFDLMPDLAKAASVLKGMGSEANVADLVKGGESLGLMNDPARFKKFLSGQVKAMAVMGKTITTSQVYEAAKYSKSAGSTLDDDFLNLTMPSLIQEMHGSSAGEALAKLTKTLRGGLQHMHLPVEQLNKLGLIEEPDKILRSKTGSIKGYAGKIKGDELLASDPGKWFQQIFNPAAEAAGFKTLSDKVMLLNQTLPGTAANIGRILIQQEETLAQHRRNYEAAPDLDKAVENQTSDFHVAAGTLKSALDDLQASVSGPAIPAIAHGMNSISSYIRMLSDLADKHPNIAAATGTGAAAGGLVGAGALAYYVSTGFGLPAAAGKLSAAASSLERAAGHMPGAPGAPPGGKPLTGPGLWRMFGLAANLGAAAYGIPSDPAEVEKMIKENGERTDSLDKSTPARALRPLWDKSWWTGDKQPASKDFTLGSTGGFRPAPGAYPQGGFHTIDGPAYDHMQSNLGRLPSATMPGPLGGTGPIDVTGKVTADVTSHIETSAVVKVEVTASPELIARQTFQSVVSKPSTGPSMPQTAVGSPGAVGAM